MPDESYFRVGSRIWLERWDDDMRLAALYLLTCKHRTTEGIFHLPQAYGAADLRWPVKRYSRAFSALAEDGFIEWDPDSEVVLIVKALRWQAPGNPNQMTAAVRKLRMLPPTRLLHRFRESCESLAPSLAKHIAEHAPEVFAKP